MRPAFRILGLCLLLLATNASAVKTNTEKEKLDWALFSFPPFIVANARGVASPGTDASRILSDLQGKLPEFQHITSSVSVSTLLTMLKEKRKVCSAWVYRTPERESLAYFTAFFPIPSHGIVVRSQDMNRIREMKSVSLKYLLENTTMHLGLEKDRSYGDVLDKIIKAAPQDKITYVEGGSNSSEALVKMLLNGRVNYMLEFPQVVAYFNETMKLDPNLYFNDIEEASTVRVVNIVCTKSRWGRMLSRKIDRALQELAQEQSFRDLVEVYYPEEVKIKYRKEFDAFYKERAKGPMTSAPLGK